MGNLPLSRFKVIDLTPPCAHYSFVYDSATPMLGAKPFFIGGSGNTPSSAGGGNEGRARGRKSATRGPRGSG